MLISSLFHITVKYIRPAKCILHNTGFNGEGFNTVRSVYFHILYHQKKIGGDTILCIHLDVDGDKAFREGKEGGRCGC